MSKARIKRVRDQVKNGTYLTGEKIGKTAEILLEELTKPPQYVYYKRGSGRAIYQSCLHTITNDDGRPKGH